MTQEHTRFGFVTAVQLGLGCVEELYAIGGSVEFLMTLPDDIDREKSGRVFLDGFASDHHIPLHKVPNINDPEAIHAIRAYDIDWLFIIGWSQIAGREVLDEPTAGCIGVHPTLLPEGRGRASIPWAIIRGLDKTGATMFQLDAGVDTGPIIAQVPIPINADETATTLYARVARAHRSLISEAYPDLCSGSIQLVPQDESLASVWPGRKPADGRLDSSMTIAEMDRLVRATTRPYPGAFVENPDGTATIVWAGSTTRPARSVPLAIPASDGTYWATEVAPRY